MGATHNSLNNPLRAVAFVVARLTSSRLSNKQFRKIGDRPLIKWIVDNLEQSKELDEIVITTVASPENIPLQNFAKENGLSCFRYEGDVDHVTNRLRKAAEKYNAEICVLISGDCPLIHSPAIDQMVQCLRQNTSADIPLIPTGPKGMYPALEGIAVARRKAWQVADDLSDRPEFKEHFFPIMSIRPELFEAVDCCCDEVLYFPKHRLSVDTSADLTFMNKLYDEITVKNKNKFNIPSVLSLLQQRPDLLKINQHVHQRGVAEKTGKILFVVDAGAIFGYGHLMRSTELAMQIVERLGWQVDFMVDDETSALLVEDNGMRALWGAVGREPAEQPAHRQGISDLFSDHYYNLAVLDVYCRRDLLPGWRNLFPSDTGMIVLNNAGDWAEEADRVIVPEVFEEEGRGGQWMGGLDYIIIRREIRYAKDKAENKDIDVLAYLQLPEHVMLVKKIAADENLKLVIIDGFSHDFPNLLARSRFFISGFGYSFYEAIYLNTMPITLPTSDAHMEAALFFYEQVGLSPLVIDPVNDKASWPAMANVHPLERKLTDGTERIVLEIAQFISDKILI